MSSKTRLYPLYLLFFLSGFPALIYQVIWQRALFAIYGTNIQSTTIIVAIFLFGLGLGALSGGWISTLQQSNLLRWFGALEILISIFGYFSLHILRVIGDHTLFLPLIAVSLVVFCLLLLPTLLMGASLPILVAYLTKRLPNVGQSVGALYSANTFGAAIACFCVATFLIHYLGQTGAIIIAATINCVVGFSAFILAFLNYFNKSTLDPLLVFTNLGIEKNNISKLHFYLILFLSALTGYIALSYEILWFHVYSFVTGSRGHDFALFLGYYLSGIAFGAYVCAKYFSKEPAKRLIHNYQLLFYVLSISAVAAYLVIPLITIILQHSTNINYILSLIGFATLMFGITFPLLSNYCVSIGKRTGVLMGKFYFANIIGSTVSVLITGFVLMNVCSLPVLAKYIFAFALLCSIVPLFLSQLSKLELIQRGGILAGFAIFLLVITSNVWQHSYDKMLYKIYYNSAQPLRYIVENNVGTIAVTQENAVFGGGVYDGFFNLDPIQNVNRIWRAYAVPLFAPNPQNVLMIGLSSGSWAQVIANNPEVKHLTIIEINPGYLQLIAKYQANVSLLHNPKVSIILDDGRRWLRRNPTQKFDLIVMNTTYHWRAYTTFLTSKDFLAIIKEHLLPTGIFYVNTTFSLNVIKTTLHEFQYVATLQNFLIASRKPISIDRKNFKHILLNYTIDGQKVFNLHKKEDQATVKKMLAIPEESMRSRKQLEELTSNSTVITDDNMLEEWL